MDSPVIAPPADGSPGAVASLAFESDRHPAPSRLRAWWRYLRYPLAIYVASRLLFLGIAIVDSIWHGGTPLIDAGRPLGWTPLNSLLHENYTYVSEATNWDGMWYVRLATLGYPHDHLATHLAHWQTTLGFFPLYSMMIWLVWHVLFVSPDVAGLLIAMVGGFIGVVLVGQLAREWWDEAAARRAMLFLCLFPGAIVFSMDYSEGVLIPLAAGCLLALQHRRWLVAGICAAFATAIGPIGLAIVAACVVACAVELYQRGWRRGRASLIAPLLAPVGVGAFGIFLWSWTGTPLASFYAQRYGWNEKSSPLAIPHDISKAYYELIGHTANGQTIVNLNYYSGAVGTLFLLVGLYWMLRGDRSGAEVAGRTLRVRIPLPAIAWTLWVALLTLTSWNTPPNPRMLICAFPALMVWCARLRGAAFASFMGVAVALTIVMSWLTYVGTPLRP